MGAIGDYILYPDPGQAYSEAGVDAFLQRLYRTTDLRIQTLDYLRNREEWDFAMVVFNGTDTISHAMWKYMDKTHPLHDPAAALKYGEGGGEPVSDFPIFPRWELAEAAAQFMPRP